MSKIYSNNINCRIGIIKSDTLRLAVTKKPAACMRLVERIDGHFDVITQEIAALEQENRELKEAVRELGTKLAVEKLVKEVNGK